MARGKPLVRQWNLLKALQSHRFGVDTETLAQCAGCSKRQVQRDLAVLESVGFPVSFEMRDFGKRFWKLSPHFIENEGMILNLTEVLSLFLSRQMLSPFSGTLFGDGLNSVLEKIKSIVPKTALDYFYGVEDSLIARSTKSSDYSKYNDIIQTINNCIIDNIVLRLTYASPSKDAYTCDYHPYGLIFFESSLYCVGYMSRYSQVRVIKIDRIIEAEPTDSKFKRPEDFTLSQHFKGSFGIITAGRPEKIRLRLFGWAAREVREQCWHPSQSIENDSDDELLVQFELSNTVEFTRWVLGFGANAKVESPPRLAAEIKQQITRMQKRYQ
jgi:predicted DNA-binding transcriptional regulator YafY